MIELATVKRKRKSKFIAGVKPKSQHFTVLEFYVPKRCLVEFCQTQITTVKCAVCELKFRKVFVGKIATAENTVFVFTFCQRIISVKGFVCDINFLHFSVLSFGTCYTCH
jgi:hypothetical protein